MRDRLIELPQVEDREVYDGTASSTWRTLGDLQRGRDSLWESARGRH